MGRRVSVLHVVLSTSTGGMENVIYNLIAAHDRDRVAVQVACLDEIGPLSRKMQELGVASSLVPRMVPGLSLIYPAALARHIRASGCSIVHTHSGCWSKTAAACAWTPGVRLVYTEHGRAFPETRDRVLANRIAIRLTDRVVAVGEPLRRYLVDEVGLPTSKVVTIRNGIDTERFKACAETRLSVRAELGYSPEDVVVAMVARLVEVKNHKLLLEAFRIVAASFNDARLLIVGDGPLRGRLDEMTRTLSLSSRVRFAGDRADVGRLLTGVDIATLSSLSEGTSLTLLEAMATSLPVVATRVGGNADVITPGRDGILVDLDAGDYANAVTDLVQSPSKRQVLGENARRTVEENWSIHHMARQYEALYAELTP